MLAVFLFGFGFAVLGTIAGFGYTLYKMIVAP